MSRLSLKALQAAAGAAAGEAVYVDDVFSTYLYEGNGSTQTITNGIDLDGEGGLVWIKNRAATDGAGNTANHILMDTVLNGRLRSNTTGALSAGKNITDLSTGFSVTGTELNYSGDNFVSWTFRKQPGFFDIVTYTGTGSAQNISHNLGSVPGCIIIKNTSNTADWTVYHRGVDASAPEDYNLALNKTDARDDNIAYFNDTAPTSTVFTVNSDSTTNTSGDTYVAYLFAHDAQDFGTDSDESIIKCGSYTTNASAEAIVDLGFEPQWVLFKKTNSNGNWVILDNMRGWAMGDGRTGPSNDAMLFPNWHFAENVQAAGEITPTGFRVELNANIANGGDTYAYVAIRRPHKPASEFAATDLFDLGTRNGVDDNPIDITGVNFPVDAALITSTNQQEDRIIGSRLTGKNALFVNAGNTETDRFANPGWDHQDGVTVLGDLNKNTYSYIDYFFRRAPGFFDVVAYNTTGSTLVLDHNLGVAPEFMMIKGRSIAANWYAYHKDLGNTKTLQPTNDTAASTSSSSYWNNTSPTATQVTIGSFSNYNLSNNTGILYLFASNPGISKVGSYTGTGSNVNVNCGFTSGARFVLVKRTDAEGHWYLWDSARGIVAGIDPFLELSRNRAQIATTDYIDPLSSGFTITSSASSEPDINASGGSYIFLAIA